MRIRDIMFFEDEDSVDESGTYIKFVPSEDSKQRIYNVAKDLVENPLDPEQYHITIVFSRKEINPPYTEMDINAPASVTSLDALGDAGAKVLHLDCAFAERKHEYYRDQYGATHDYDSFVPHLTISYDGEIKDDSEERLKEIGTIYFVREYVEPLDLNWKENNALN